MDCCKSATLRKTPGRMCSLVIFAKKRSPSAPAPDRQPPLVAVPEIRQLSCVRVAGLLEFRLEHRDPGRHVAQRFADAFSWLVEKHVA